jgi:hypothetical protein
MALGACNTTVGENPTPGESTSPPGVTRVSEGSDPEGQPYSTDQATLDYVDCLQSHGIDAMVGSQGEIMLPVDLENGDHVVSSSDEQPLGLVEAEEACQLEVPDYVPVDSNER